jgi:hypothetical protein
MDAEMVVAIRAYAKRVVAKLPPVDDATMARLRVMFNPPNTIMTLMDYRVDPAA